MSDALAASSAGPSPPTPSSPLIFEFDESDEEPVWLSTDYKTTSATWDRSTHPIPGTYRPPTLDTMPDRHPEERQRVQELRDGATPDSLPKVSTAKKRQKLKFPPLSRKDGRRTNTTMSSSSPTRSRPESVPNIVPDPHSNWFDTPQGKTTLPDCPSLFHCSPNQRRVGAAHERARAAAWARAVPKITVRDYAYPQRDPIVLSGLGFDLESTSDGLPPTSNRPWNDGRVGRARSNAIRITKRAIELIPRRERPRPFVLDPPLRDAFAIGPERLPRLPETIKGQKAKIARLEAEEAARRKIDPKRKLYITRQDMADMEAEGRRNIAERERERKAAEAASAAVVIDHPVEATESIGQCSANPPSSTPVSSQLLPRHANRSKITRKLVPKRKSGTDTITNNTGATPIQTNHLIPTPYRPAASPRYPSPVAAAVLTEREGGNPETSTLASSPKYSYAQKGKWRAGQAITMPPAGPVNTNVRSSQASDENQPVQSVPVKKHIETMRRIPRELLESNKAKDTLVSTTKPVVDTTPTAAPVKPTTGVKVTDAACPPNTIAPPTTTPKVTPDLPSPVDSGLPKRTSLKHSSPALPTVTEVVRSRSEQPTNRPRNNEAFPRVKSQVLSDNRILSPRRAVAARSPRTEDSVLGFSTPARSRANAIPEVEENDPPLSRCSSGTGTDRSTMTPSTSLDKLEDLVPMRTTASGISLPRDDVPGKLFFFPPLPQDSVGDDETQDESSTTSPKSPSSRLRSLSVLASTVCSYIPFVTTPKKEDPPTGTESQGKEPPSVASAALSSILSSTGSQSKRPLKPVPTAERPDGSIRSRGSQIGPSIKEGDMRLSTIKRNDSPLKLGGVANRENRSPIGTTTFAYELSTDVRVSGAEAVNGLALSPTIHAPPVPKKNSRVSSKLSAILRQHDNGTIHGHSALSALVRRLAEGNDVEPDLTAGSPSPAPTPASRSHTAVPDGEPPAYTPREPRPPLSPRRKSIINYFEDSDGNRRISCQKEALAGGPEAIVARFREAFSRPPILRDDPTKPPTVSVADSGVPTTPKAGSHTTSGDDDQCDDEGDWEDDDSERDDDATVHPSPASTIRQGRTRSDSVDTIRAADL